MSQRAKQKRSTAELAALQTKRNTLANRIAAWRKIQEVYMPCTIALLAAWTTTHATASRNAAGANNQDVIDDADDNDNETPAHAEDIPLFLPSSLPSNLRSDATIAVLLPKEGRLRIAVADDSLADIRRLRRTMAGITQFKQLNTSGTGQKSNTRVRTLYTKFKDRVTVAAMRYRAAYAALGVLQPPGDWTTRLRALADKDITGPGNDDDDDLRTVGEGHREISWIWRVRRPVSEASGDELDPEEFNQYMAIEWAKARARARRWDEEVALIQEEMRRVIAFFEWKAKWWRQSASQRSQGITPALSSGLTAYAEKQASMYDGLSLKFYNMWVPHLMVQNLLAQSTTAARAARPSPRQSQLRDPVELSSDDDDNGDADADVENDNINDKGSDGDMSV